MEGWLYAVVAEVRHEILPPLIGCADPNPIRVRFGRLSADGLESPPASIPRVIYVWGVRGSGKTRALRDMVRGSAPWVDCEDPLQAAPLADLETWIGAIDSPYVLVLDEVTSLPNWIQVLEAVANALTSTAIIATSSRLASPADRLAAHLQPAKGAKATPPPSFPFTVCEFVCASDNQGENREVGQTTPSRPAFDRVFECDLRVHLPRLKRTVILKLLKSLFEHCSCPVHKSFLARELGISRSYLDACLHALQQCGLLAYLTPYSVPSQCARNREIVSAQSFLPNPELLALTLSREAPPASIPKQARYRLLIWSHLRAAFPGATFHFWRTKEGRSLDFVFDYQPRCDLPLCVGGAPSPLETAAVQCAADDGIDPSSFSIFRRQHSLGFNYVVLPNPKAERGKQLGAYMCGGFADALAAAALPPGPERIQRQQQWLYLCTTSELLAMLRFKDMPPVIRNEWVVQRSWEAARWGLQAEQEMEQAREQAKRKAKRQSKRQPAKEMITLTTDQKAELIIAIMLSEYRRYKSEWPESPLTQEEYARMLIESELKAGPDSHPLPLPPL